MRNFVIFALILTVKIWAVSAVDYNAEVEAHINSQRKKWCSGTSYHEVDLKDSDRTYFDKHCGANATVEYDGLLVRAVLGSRQEIRCMRPQEREGFMSALNRMKRNRVGGVSEYDNFVVRHDGRVARPAHFCPGFHGWHREYLTGFERAMRSHCRTCMLPYWDSRLDKRLGGDPADSVLFSEYLLGNARGVVTTGFAANWPIESGACRTAGSRLRRNMNRNAASFYDDDDVNSANVVTDYRDFSYPWSEEPEFRHGYVHSAFGANSHMNDLMCSPSDPAFFLHHTFVDLIFEKARISLKRNRRLIYPATSPRSLPPRFDDSNGHVQLDCARNAPMRPFNSLVNDYGLVSDSYTEDVYSYEETPGDVECRQDGDCCANGSSEFLWCNNRGDCVSKVRRGGRVNPRFPARACHCERGQPRIVNSFCACN